MIHAATSGVIAGARRRSGGYETLGKATGGSTWTVYAGTIYSLKSFTPTHTGTITQVTLYSANSTSTNDLKIGVYQDSSGSPGALVGTPVTFTDIGTWTVEQHTFTGFSIPVSSGVVYWLALRTSGNTLTCYYDNENLATKYADASYASAWPDPAGTTSNISRLSAFQVRNEY